MIRLGLCCVFKEAPIKFKHTTARYLGQFDREEQLERLSAICRHNGESLLKAVTFCRDNGIGDFRVNSQILPLKTHPDCGFDMEELPDFRQIIQQFEACGEFCRSNNIRTSFHPDQFILLSALNPEIVENSIKDLIYQAQVAQWIGADVINIHGGGAYGDKKSGLKRLADQITRLPDSVRSRLTLENDDRTYTPKDLLPLCRDMGIPMVYDVHHHRCAGDKLSIEAATEAALKTWNREPLFHLSSPIDGWQSPQAARTIRSHHDYIDPADFPECWEHLDITIEMEAKAKELAIFQFKKDLGHRLVFRA